jgi:hypothetical protein
VGLLLPKMYADHIKHIAGPHEDRDPQVENPCVSEKRIMILYTPIIFIDNIILAGGSYLTRTFDHSVSVNRLNMFHITQSSRGTPPYV